jgi:hypothetical protein
MNWEIPSPSPRTTLPCWVHFPMFGCRAKLLPDSRSLLDRFLGSGIGGATVPGAKRWGQPPSISFTK